jgi:hypothetical protein
MTQCAISSTLNWGSDGLRVKKHNVILHGIYHKEYAHFLYRKKGNINQMNYVQDCNLYISRFIKQQTTMKDDIPQV